MTITPVPPLFIVGAPRSGNTLTRRVLMASGQIYIPPETFVVGELIGRWPRLMWLTWREKVWLFCAYFEKHRQFHTFELGDLTPFAREMETLPVSDRSLRRLLEEAYRYFARAHGFTETRWGDKTPYNTVHIDDILRFYPNGYYLHLVRNGLDSVASQVRADMRDLPASAERWISANTACLKHLKRARRGGLMLSYETLVTEPEPGFRQIFQWAGLDFEARFLTEIPQGLGDVGRLAHHSSVTQAITPASVGRWREALSEADLDALPGDFWAMMARLGYPASAAAALQEDATA